jgi:hypothetical protein
MKETTINVIFCPPVSIYPTPPSDISKCEKVNCPICNGEMWLSVKKKTIKQMCEAHKQEFFFGCHSCFEKEINKIKKSGIFHKNTYHRIDI